MYRITSTSKYVTRLQVDQPSTFETFSHRTTTPESLKTFPALMSYVTSSLSAMIKSSNRSSMFKSRSRTTTRTRSTTWSQCSTALGLRSSTSRIEPTTSSLMSYPTVSSTKPCVSLNMPLPTTPAIIKQCRDRLSSMRIISSLNGLNDRRVVIRTRKRTDAILPSSPITASIRRLVNRTLN